MSCGISLFSLYLGTSVLKNAGSMPPYGQGRLPAWDMQEDRKGIEMRGKVLAALLALSLLAGCAASEAAEKAVSDEAQEASSGGAETAEEEDSSSFQELFEIQAEGIDYLSVEGIHIPEGVTVTMVGKDSESGFWKQVHAGAEQAVEDLNTALGYTGDAKAELIYDASATGDVAEQIDIIDQMLDKNPDALIVGFVDINSGRTQLELAESNGVPVFSVDSAIENSLIVSTSQTDNYQAGAEAARQLASLMGDSGQAALLVHSSETETGIERERGFIDEMEQNHPDIEIVNISYQEQDERSVDDIVAAVLSEYPDLKAYQAMNEETTEALVSALELYGPEDRTVIAAGFDASSAEIGDIEDGKLAGAIVQNPYGMGYAAAVAAFREIARMENASVIDTGYCWIDAENLSDPAVQMLIYK